MTVRNNVGEIVGYQCWECHGTFQSMWGNYCNECRSKAKQHSETLAELKRQNDLIEEQNRILKTLAQ